MEHGHELALTQLLNDFLAAPANAALQLVGKHASDRPWDNFQAMQFLVFAILLVLFAVAKTKFSVDKPGKLQHMLEAVYEFLKNTADEVGIHGAAKMLPFFGTLFFFVLVGNLIGIIPGFESPTMFAPVPLGCAIVTFLYYNWIGIKEQGPLKYAAHFAGPMPLLAPIMVPIEIVSHLARPLSLTIRLYANMFAGEQVTLAFLGLTYVVAPAIFMGLHVFVSFLQAYIFTLMAMIYVSSAASHEH